MFQRSRYLVASAVALVAVGGGAAAADAAQVYVTGPNIVYNGFPSETNHVTVTQLSSLQWLFGDVMTMEYASACGPENGSSTQVRCFVEAASPTRPHAYLSLGDGNDTADLSRAGLPGNFG